MSKYNRTPQMNSQLQDVPVARRQELSKHDANSTSHPNNGAGDSGHFPNTNAGSALKRLQQSHLNGQGRPCACQASMGPLARNPNHQLLQHDS